MQFIKSLIFNILLYLGIILVFLFAVMILYFIEKNRMGIDIER